jgi:hypothetical protein
LYLKFTQNRFGGFGATAAGGGFGSATGGGFGSMGASTGGGLYVFLMIHQRSSI